MGSHRPFSRPKFPLQVVLIESFVSAVRRFYSCRPDSGRSGHVSVLEVL